MTEVVDVLGCITDRIDIPVIAVADNGYGNALNVQRTVRLFERAGASGIQLEDQTLPKRCGHLKDKSLVSKNEMVGKIKAACDARRNVSTLIVARTDAIAVDGFEAALDRADAYVEAGADVLFIEAPRTIEEMAIIGDTFRSRIPLLLNLVEGGRTPLPDQETIAELGYRLAIFPGSAVRALVPALVQLFDTILGTAAPSASGRT